MKSAGLRKAQFVCNVRDAAARGAQVGDGHVSAQVVLDALVRLTFGVELAPDGCGRGVQFIRQGGFVRPVRRRELAQSTADARGEAARVLVLHDDIFRRQAQKLLGRRLALHHAQVEVAGVEFDRGGRLLIAQSGTEHGAIFRAVRGFRVGESGLQNRDTAVDEPARRTVQHDEQCFMGKCRIAAVPAFFDDGEAGVPSVLAQGQRKIVEEHIEIAQHAFDRRPQCLAMNRASTQECKASGFHAPGIAAEEFIVECSRNQAPKGSVAGGRHAGLGRQ